ncbi:glycoside hydrolase superfamily [Immersiella caudata]|uniref:chitinase n=1 Tax=Immersiella caudata TaxID=314043 RepID=A0AA39U4C0_9PEZI|nr:glycoside hydrolase superfamily [Immersiella caudata]
MSTGRINAVYYPSWRAYRGVTPATLPVDSITHILYAFIRYVHNLTHLPFPGPKPDVDIISVLRINEDGSLRVRLPFPSSTSSECLLTEMNHLQHADERADTILPVDGETGALRALAKLKSQHPHLRTLVSIGGGSGSAEFPALTSNPDAIASFFKNIKDFIAKYNFDGVDSSSPFPTFHLPKTNTHRPVDWEHPTTPSQSTAYISLLTSLRTALPPPHLLTTALPPAPYILKHISLPSLALLLSHLHLMTYDFTGPWTLTAGHHAQLYPSPSIPSCKSISAGVSYLLDRGFPAEKIILGIPAYAQCFRGVTSPGETFDKTKKEACCAVDYCDLSEDIVRNAKICKDTGAASYVEFGSEKRGFMSFDVPETVGMKAGYAREKGIGGLFYWTGAGDRGRGEGSLVVAGWEALRR